MVLSTYKKQRIIYLYNLGYKSPTIKKLLQEEGVAVTRQSIHRFLRVYRETGTIKRREASGRPTKLTPTVRALVEQKMMEDDEITASQLHKYLIDNDHLGSLSTILRCRTSLGWTFRGSAYCQLIRSENKIKRLEWARQYLHEADSGFEDVVWTDESSIQVDTHKRFCYRKVGCAPKSKPRYHYLHLLPLVTAFKYVDPSIQSRCMCGLESA